MSDIINKAKGYAMRKHMGQKDDSNVPFVFHPIQAAQILMQVTNDENLIAAAYLHDILEDTQTTYGELKNEFGEDVANLVREVTKVKPDNKTAAYFPNLKTKRGALLKFADRLSNLSRMDNWTDDKQKWYLRESRFWRVRANEPMREKPIEGQLTVDDAIQGKGHSKS